MILGLIIMNITKLEQHINSKIYNRGYKYYNEDRIIGAYYDKSKHRIVGAVTGSDIYEVIFNFDRADDLRSVSCTCPYFKEEKDVCKHLAALYFYLSYGNLEKLLKDNKEVSHTARLKKPLLKNMDSVFLNSYISNNTSMIKSPLETCYRLHYSPYDFNTYVKLSVKIGINKLYVVNNFVDLFKSIENNTQLPFGKDFTFDPKSHRFKEADKEIFDFFYDLYTTQKLISQGGLFSSNKVITNKGINLNEKLFIRFLKLLGDIPFELRLEDSKIDNVIVDFKNTPFNLSIDTNNNNTVTKLNSTMPYQVLSDDLEIIIYSDNKIYIINEKNKIYPFIKFSIDNNADWLEFSEKNEEKIISFISDIEQDDNVFLSKGIQEKFIQEDLKISLYLDKFKNGISAEIIFKYGDQSINPFTNIKVNPYIKRDFNKEEKIHHIFEKSYFIVTNGKLYLSSSNRIYNFFKDTLPILKDICDIYYTDAVKNYYTPRLVNTKTTVNTLLGGSLFSINIDMDGFDRDEIYEILCGIKEKKKYHMLKSNRLINLEDNVPAEVYDLLESIDFSEIDENTISLGKYRAINVFSNLQDKNDYKIENGDKIFSLIDTIKILDLESIDVPVNFKNILRDYQSTGFKWLKNLAQIEFGGILADDMGLGKTIQAIAFMSDIKEQGTSLVIAPSSLIYNWQEEIKKFAPDLKTLVLAGQKEHRKERFELIENHDVVITSYPLIRRDIEMYKRYEFNCCILDEAQHIKNPSSLNAKSVKSLKSKYRFTLTGTPIENSLTELWSIFDFILPGYLQSQRKFSEEFEKPIVRDKDKKKLKKLTKSIAPFILRRKKADVLKELPKKIESKMICELSKKQRQIYDAYLFDMKEKIDKKISENGFEKSKFEILSYITRLRQICCHPGVFIENYTGTSGKFELLNELLEELIESKHKILLFSQFTSLLSLIRQELEQRNISYNYLDGQTKVTERMDLVHEFNNSDKDVFLISLKAGGTGLNLTSADTVIHFDPWWNPAVEDQATDRAHRIGQLNSVNVYKLIAKDTIEEKIYKLQLRKKELIDSVIKKGENFITALSENEIRELFEM